MFYTHCQIRYGIFSSREDPLTVLQLSAVGSEGPFATNRFPKSSRKHKSAGKGSAIARVSKTIGLRGGMAARSGVSPDGPGGLPKIDCVASPPGSSLDEADLVDRAPIRSVSTRSGGCVETPTHQTARSAVNGVPVVEGHALAQRDGAETIAPMPRGDY